MRLQAPVPMLARPPGSLSARQVQGKKQGALAREREGGSKTRSLAEARATAMRAHFPAGHPGSGQQADLLR